MITDSGKEKPFTRVLAAALGAFFLFGPIMAGISNTKLANEILNSNSVVMGLAVTFIIVSIVLGIVLLKVGITGRTPSWLKIDIDLK